MSTSVKDIAWVAGILEGEGTFCLNNNSPRLAVAMTDEDVMQKFCSIVDATKRLSCYIDPMGVRKPRYTFTLMGNFAIQWVMTIYPLMGLRRRQEIRELIFHWKEKSLSRQGTRKKDAKNYQGLAFRLRKQGYSDFQIEMAKILLAGDATEEQILKKLEELDSDTTVQ